MSRGSDAQSRRAADAEGPKSSLHSNLLAGIRSRNVAFQLLNGLRLTRDDPFHQVANRDYSHHVVILYAREMAKTVVGHDGHTLVYAVLRTHEHHRAGHDLTDLGFLRGMAHQDYFSGVVPLRQNTDQFVIGNDQQRPDAVLGHLLNRVVDHWSGVTHRTLLSSLLFSTDPIVSEKFIRSPYSWPLLLGGYIWTGRG